jgi:hypothetical protein
MNIKQRLCQLEERAPKPMIPVNFIVADDSLSETLARAKMLSEVIKGVKNIFIIPAEWRYEFNEISKCWTPKQELIS